jgi:hypothetical protein
MKNTTAIIIIFALVGIIVFQWLIGSGLIGIFIGGVVGWLAGPSLLKRLNVKEEISV